MTGSLAQYQIDGDFYLTRFSAFFWQAAWRSAEEEARRLGAAVHSSKVNAVVMYV